MSSIALLLGCHTPEIASQPPSDKIGTVLSAAFALDARRAILVSKSVVMPCRKLSAEVPKAEGEMEEMRDDGCRAPVGRRALSRLEICRAALPPPTNRHAEPRFGPPIVRSRPSCFCFCISIAASP